MRVQVFYLSPELLGKLGRVHRIVTTFHAGAEALLPISYNLDHFFSMSMKLLTPGFTILCIAIVNGLKLGEEFLMFVHHLLEVMFVLGHKSATNVLFCLNQWGAGWSLIDRKKSYNTRKKRQDREDDSSQNH